MLNLRLSPIGIDLGGKYTGVCLSHLNSSDELPEHTNTKHFVISISHKDVQFSQASRRANRHQSRCKRRNDFVKRVALQLVEATICRPLNDNEKIAIRHYLNNRGYNYVDITLDEGLDDNTLEFLNSHIIKSQHILSRDQFLDAIEEDEFRNAVVSSLNRIKSQKDSNTIIKNIKNFIEGFEKNCIEGHRHRKNYFKNISADIPGDPRLSQILEKIPKNKFINLLGHLSNLKWKNLHRYLSKHTQKYNEDGLRTEFLKMLKSFKYPKGSEASKSVLNLIQEIEQVRADQWIDLLSTVSPEKTIPPYEARTNTGMEKDQTLLLNPDKLTEYYPEWQNLIPHITTLHPFIVESLDHFKLRDRKRIISQAHHDKKRDAYILQRYLDLNKKLDVFKLKDRLSYLDKDKALPAFFNEINLKMQRTLGSSLYNTIIKIAQRYNEERIASEQGTWLNQPTNLCERSDLNPPRKEKMLPLLIGAILGEDFVNNKTRWSLFKAFWASHKLGRSLLKNKCRDIEEERKKSGNSFKNEFDDHAAVTEIKNAIKTFLNHDEPKAKKYHNPHSLAQLYTILETNRSGFLKNCTAVTLENYWRSQQIAGMESLAPARRLPSDCIRPFDGVLDRMLQRIAFEIASQKWEQIKNTPAESTLIVPIYIEQNRFEFEASFRDAQNKKKKKLEPSIKRQNELWEDKYQRIVNASQGICPYTGKALGTAGELDHIYPRSLSLKKFGMIFNSEVNLIYCSSEGNRIKKGEHYRLINLHKNYLLAQFGTDDTAHIREIITHEVAKIESYKSHHLLTPLQQKAVKHALFLESNDPSFKTVTNFLKTQYKTRVNGTQKYLAKKIMQILNNLAKSKQLKIEYEIKQIDAEEVHCLRSNLANKQKHLKKDGAQTFSSHAIDATLTLGIGLKTFVQFKNPLDNQWMMAHLLPTQVDLINCRAKEKYNKQNINSKSLFKNSIYAERFIPIWIQGQESFIGFSEKDLFKIKPSSLDLLFNALEKFSTKCPGTSVAELQNKTREKPICFPINRQRALEFIHDSFHHSSPSNDKNPYITFLNSLRYYTKKEPITLDLIKKLELPKLTITFTSKKSDLLGEFQATLLLPAIRDWQRLYNDPLLKEILPNPTPTQLDDFLKRYFLKNNPTASIGNKPLHKTVRKVFSLPIVPLLSGTMMRIRRQTPEDQYLYQLQTVEGSPNQGLQIKNNKLTQEEVFLKAYMTRNLSTIDGSNHSDEQDHVRFDLWREIPDIKLEPKVLKIEMKPHSKNRRIIRITQHLSEFLKTIEKAILEQPAEITHPLTIPDNIKCKNKLFSGTLKARSGNIQIISTGNLIVYEFVSESTPKWIESRYLEQGQLPS